MPTIANCLALAALTNLPVFEFLELPQFGGAFIYPVPPESSASGKPPESSASLQPVAKPTVAKPPPAKPAPAKPTTSRPSTGSASRRRPVLRQPVPQPEPSSPAAVKEQIESTERNKTALSTGVWAAYSIIGNGFTAMSETDWFPFKMPSWLGFRFGFGYSFFQSDWELDIYNSTGAGLVITEAYKENSSGGLFFFLAPAANLRIKKIDLNFALGISFTRVRPINMHEYYDFKASILNSGDFAAALGMYVGADFGIKLGPGVFFTALNGSYMFGWNKNIDKDKSITGIETWDNVPGYLLNAMNLNAGIGYRLIIGKKP
jgi:hypothetical protein